MAAPVASASLPPSDEQESVGYDRAAERAVLGTVALSTTLAPLNSTMVAVALPAIMLAYGAPLAAAGWLVTSYLVVMAAIQPVAGKLGDQLGRRRLMLGGLIGFGVASLGALVAPVLPVLILFRLFQAVGAAIALPNGMALVREVVPEQRRAASFGLVGAIVSGAAAAGPPLGGFLVGTAGWQAIFYINVPVVAAALLLGWRTLPNRPRAGRHTAFDLAGAVLLCALLVGLSLLLRSFGKENGPLDLLALALLFLLGTLFVRQELRHADPVFHPRFFAARAFSAATAAVALSNLAMYSILLALPIVLAGKPGWTSGRVGLVLTALSAATVVCAPIGGRMADRLGRRWPAVVGLTVFTVALTPFLLGAQALPAAVLAICLAIGGAGLGFANPGIQTSAVEAVAADKAGAASGMYSTSRYIGSIAGSSILPVLLGGPSPSPAEVQHVFAMIVLAAGCSAAVSFGLRSKR